MEDSIMNKNSSNKDNLNKDVAFVSLCSIDGIFNQIFPFLGAKDSIRFLNSCKSIREKINNSLFASQFYEKLGKEVGLSLEFKGNGELKKITLSPVENCTLAKEYYNKIKVLHIFKDAGFINLSDFSFCVDFVDKCLVNWSKSHLYNNCDVSFLSDVYINILDNDKSLFFESLSFLRKLIDSRNGTAYDSLKYRNDTTAQIDSSIYNLIGDLVRAVYKKEKNIASVFDFAAEFVNCLFYDDKKVYLEREKINESILNQVFFNLKYIAENNKRNIEFKYIVDFCKKTQCLGYRFSDFSSKEFLWHFKNRINSGLENDYDPKVANELKIKLGKENYLSLWKKENRRNRSVKNKDRKPRVSGNEKKFREI